MGRVAKGLELGWRGLLGLTRRQPRTQGFIFAPVALPLRKNPGPGWSRASQNVGSNNYLTSGRGG